MKLTKYKHRCDSCGKNTIINSGDRLTWYKYKQESLCASCYRELPEDQRKDASAMTTLHLKSYFTALKYWISSGKEGSSEYTLNDEERALLKRFGVIKDE